MVGLQIRDDADSPGPQSAQPSPQSMPLWVPIIICAVLVVIPISMYIAYLFYNRQPRRVEDKEATPVPAPPSPDIKFSDPFDTRQPSTNKWTLAVPKWTTAGGVRRGSDGGFPPGTRHITFPDPTRTASVESLDNKAPPSPAPQARHPTPPPPAYVPTQPRKRSYARAI